MKKIPNEIKKVKGTLNVTKAKKDGNLKAKQLTEKPDYPKRVKKNETKRKIWDDTCNWLKSVNLLSSCDLHAIEAYVHEYGRYLEAIDKIDKIGLTVKSPNGYEIPNPSISIANTALANALKLGSAFGMNPIARTKINVDEKKVETNPIIKLAKAANV